MEDKVLKDLFDKHRWEVGLEIAEAKKMDIAELQLYSSPKFRAFLYSVISSGKWVAVNKVDGELKLMIVDGMLPPHTAEIPKKDSNEKRTVYICENLERIMLSIYNDYLFDKLKHRIHPNCKSYQHGIGTGKVVRELVAQSLKTKHKVIVMKTDMRKMFDSIPIKEIDKEFNAINKELGKSQFTNLVQNLYHQNICFDLNNKPIEHFFSIGQGIATASYLCDAILYDIDKYMSENFNIYYVRYADDILLCGEECEKAFEKLKELLAEKGLALNPEKTEAITAMTYYKFLGFSIRGSNISLSSSRIEDFQKEIESRTIKYNDFFTVKKVTEYETVDNKEVIKDRYYRIYHRKLKKYIGKKFQTKKECSQFLGERRYKAALRRVIEFLYIGDGQYCWSTSVLSVINVEEDINTLNMFVIDCLRAVLTGKTKVGGLGFELSKKGGCISRGIGKNVKHNREVTPKILPYFLDLVAMRVCLLTDVDVFHAEANTMMINLSGHHSVNFNDRYIKNESGKEQELVNLENENILEKLQKLYDEYYFSTPSERSSRNRHCYFAAMNSDELSDGQLILGGDRYIKQFELERFMLSVIEQKKWEDLFDQKHFFYKGNNHMIILKNWFE